MATANPFDLLVDDDNDDPSQMIAAQKVAKHSSAAADSPPKEAAKMPTKPLPPSQAVREAKSNTSGPRGGGFSRGGPGRGRGGRGGNTREFNDNGFNRNYGGEGGSDDRNGGNRERVPYSGPRQSFRGGRNGSYGNGEAGAETERPRRNFERRSGTGHGYEMKRDGAGRGNWGTATDDATQENEAALNVDEKIASPEKQVEQEDVMLIDTGDKENKEGQAKEAEEKEKEDKEMTLEEYEKIREEKRKALLALKTEERKVVIDKELKSMQQLSLKKENDEIFVKLGSGKEKKKESIDKDEKVKKSVSISEFLKPAKGERYYTGRGRGHGRGRGDNSNFHGCDNANLASAPSIEDPSHFPTLGAK